MAAMRAAPPKALEDVDAWLANYLRLVEETQAEARRLDRLHDAAPKMLAALQRILRAADNGCTYTGDHPLALAREAVEAATQAAASPAAGGVQP